MKLIDLIIEGGVKLLNAYRQRRQQRNREKQEAQAPHKIEPSPYARQYHGAGDSEFFGGDGDVRR